MVAGWPRASYAEAEQAVHRDGIAGYDPAATVAALALVALVVSVPVALVVLALYRRAVLRAMNEAAGSGLALPVLAVADGPPPALQVARLSGATAPPVAMPAYRRALRIPWRAARAYALAGTVHALVATGLVFWANSLEVSPLRAFLVFTVLAWPVVLTVTAVAVAGRRWKAAGVVVYAVVLIAASGPYAASTLALLWVYAGIPTVALALMANRRLRTSGPFVAVVVLGAAAGALFSLDAMYWALAYQAVGSAGAALVLGAVVWATGVGVGWAVLRRLARRYEKQRVSDQMLLVAAWWLLYSLWQSFLLVPPIGLWGVVGLVPFVLYLLVLRLALRPLRSEAARVPRRRLLLLRVFGSRARSERLFHEVGLHWRYLGPIALIGAPDLAAATLEPHQLLAFLAGRLRTLFVGSRGDLDTRAATLSAPPDPDGRYRITELLCHDDTWRVAVQRLAGATDAVLVDLRGFAAHNRGIGYELQLLLSTVPLHRLVLVTDPTSDHAALDATLADAWAGVAEGSPARHTSSPLALYDLGRQTRRDVRGLLGRLCTAADHEPSDREQRPQPA